MGESYSSADAVSVFFSPSREGHLSMQGDLDRSVSILSLLSNTSSLFSGFGGPFQGHQQEFLQLSPGHCWRSRDELIRDVLLWTPTHGRAKAGRPARTYIQQLCEDTGCCPEDLPRAMNDREVWRERVRDIRATTAT